MRTNELIFHKATIYKQRRMTKPLRKREKEKDTKPMIQASGSCWEKRERAKMSKYV